jgi:hypothetical protein
MSHETATHEQHDADEGMDDDWGSVSGVFERAPSFDVAIGTLHHLEADHDPAPVYAVPYLVLGLERMPYPLGYYLGTVFATGGMIAADGWEEAMRADDLPEEIIFKCRVYLEACAI